MPIKAIDTHTELEALNTMGSYLGIPPLITLTDIDDEPDFLLARVILNEVTNSVLAMGIPCNTDWAFKLTELDAEGDTIIPVGALICDVDRPNFTERDGLVYDLKNFGFYRGVDLTAHVRWNMEFDSLPALVKQYITIAASRSLVGRVKGDQSLLQLTIPDELRVKREFQRYTTSLQDLSMLDNPETAYIANRDRTYRY